MSTSAAARRTVQLPSGPVLVGAVYGVCVVGLVAVFAGEIVVSDKDPYRSEGPVDSIVAISVFGTVALVVGVVLALRLGGTPARARVGSLVLTALAVLTIVFFWAGAPGILGACAAWCAGLTRDRQQLDGAARVAGILGVFLALLNVVLSAGGVLLAGIT